MEAALVKVHGRVQRVGYRRYVLDTAQELKVLGYIKNLPLGSVEIFAQAPKQTLEEFVEKIKAPPPPAQVRSVEVEPAEARPGLSDFEIISAKPEEELHEGFGAMQAIFADYWREFRDYRQEFKDYRQEFRDYWREFRDYRQEFKDYRQEFRDYRQEFRDFASRTDQNFQMIMQKYGEISEKLTAILNTLAEESRKTTRMLEQMQRESRETRESLERALDRLTKAVDKLLAK